jgi:hypothetical protein
MARGIDDRDEGLTEADRRAIADIRRELDAEFGPLDEPVQLSRHPDPSARQRQPSAPRASRPSGRSSRRGVSVFLLGALVGGVAGGVAGGATAYIWLRADEHLGRPPVRSALDDSPAAATPDGSALDGALGDWLDATKRGDIERQMRFYPARVPVYYTWRDVPWSAVREEKTQVFGAATTLQIVTDTPTVQLADDGGSAVTRFRKRYVIVGPVIRRRGEVVQELRWQRMADGWRIVAERDAEVLAP